MNKKWVSFVFKKENRIYPNSMNKSSMKLALEKGLFLSKTDTIMKNVAIATKTDSVFVRPIA